MRSNGKRYAAIALEKNMRLAAERLAERKLAEWAKSQEKNSGEGCPIPPAVGGVATLPDAIRKPVASACDNLAEKEKEDIVA